LKKSLEKSKNGVSTFETALKTNPLGGERVDKEFLSPSPSRHRSL